jgi:hypothetical protein
MQIMGKMPKPVTKPLRKEYKRNTIKTITAFSLEIKELRRFKELRLFVNSVTNGNGEANY